jgi:site-specific DNA-methyltransferase (adenine-specific)
MPKGSSYIQAAQSTDQQTPRDLFDALWEAFGGFDLDPCCTPDQYTARKVLKNGGHIHVPPDFGNVAGCEQSQKATGRIHLDGLDQRWYGKAFMNSPYGPALRKWVPKAVHEVECDNAELVVALVPAKTDTQWWQRYVLAQVTEEGYECDNCLTKPTEIRFIRGRLTFEGFPAPAGHASAIVVWRR